MPIDADTLVAFAHGLGSEALSAFLVALILLLWTLSGVWGFAQHYWAPRLTDRWPPALRLAVHLLIGFGAIVAAVLVFAAIARGLGDGDLLTRLDTAFAEAARQGTSAETVAAFARATVLGSSATLWVLGLAVCIALAALNRLDLMLCWLVAQFGNALLNPMLKQIFQRPRPPHDPALATGWSFPSGHSAGAVVAYGMLAYLLLRVLPPATVRRFGLPIVLTAVTLAFTTAGSRVFLQVHHLSDVLAGLASGAAWLLLCICGTELMLHRRRSPV